MSNSAEPKFYIDRHIDTQIHSNFPNRSFVNEICEPLAQFYLLGVTALPALVAVENLIVLLAMACYRAKLKHSNVYRYVASALVANVVTSALGFYHFMNYYYGLEPITPNLWWAFRKGMTLALSLVLCGNIGLLIYGIEDSTYVVGRISTPQEARKLNPRFRRKKANILICIVWALPTIYGMLAMTPWNCTWLCECTLSYASGKALCPEGPCSRLYTPMSKTYLLVVVILWTLECLGLLVLLCHSIRTVRGVHDNIAKNGNNERKHLSLRRTFIRHGASHQVVYFLLILFFICTSPVMVLFVLDFSIPGIHFSHILVNFITPLPLLYCLISPLLVCYKLSGVKSALIVAMTFSWLKPSNSRSAKTLQKRSSAIMSLSIQDFSDATPK